MVLDPIPQSLPVHFFGSRPQPPTSPHIRGTQDMWVQTHTYVYLCQLLQIYSTETVCQLIYVCDSFHCRHTSQHAHFRGTEICVCRHINMYISVDSSISSRPENMCNAYKKVNTVAFRNDSTHYIVAKMRRMPCLYRSCSAKEPYDQWLFCKKRPIF